MSDPTEAGHGGAYRALADLAHRVQPAVLRAWRAQVLATARDCTLDVARPRRSCLFLAPHSDDETLGCGATIARTVAAGGHVEVVIAADGRYSHKDSTIMSPERMRDVRRLEAVAACAALGMPEEHVVQLGHEDPHLERCWRELLGALRDALRRVDPNDVYVVSGLDLHPDHRTLNAALHEVLRATIGPRRVGVPGVVVDRRLLVRVVAAPPAARALHLVGDPLTASAPAQGVDRRLRRRQARRSRCVHEPGHQPHRRGLLARDGRSAARPEPRRLRAWHRPRAAIS